MPTKRTIVVAVDFSEPSLEALDHAIQLAKQLEASVVAVHAVEVPLYTYPDMGMLMPSDVDAPFLDGARKDMAATLDARRARGVTLEGIVRKGVPWETVNAVAEEVDAAYVVVGTHGRSGLPRLLLGSIAERVLRTAKRPVVAIHDSKRA